MSSDTRSQFWRSFAAVIAIALAGFFVNVYTAALSPRVWQDEVMLVDPAVNTVIGRGWVSSCWPAQRPDEFFAGNSPLYSMMLIPWMKAFGVGIVAHRTMNDVLVTLTIIVLWLGAWRRGWIRSPLFSALLPIGLLGGYWTAYSYRGGRYDMLGLLLLGGCWLAATIRARVWRYVTIFVIAMILPWAGLQNLPAMVAIGAVALVASRGRGWRELLTALIGAVAGGMTLAAWLTSHHVLDAFVRSARLGSGRNDKSITWVASIVQAIKCDPSTIVLLFGAILVIASLWTRKREEQSRQAIRFAAAAVGFALFVPLFVAVVVKFPEYYAYMKHTPALICLLAAAQTLASRRIFAAIVALTVLVSAAPFPLRLGYAMKSAQARDYGAVEQAVRDVVKPDDIAFCSYAYYYPVRLTAHELFVPSSLVMMTPADWDSVSVMIIDHEQEEIVFDKHQPRAKWMLVSQWDPWKDKADHTRYGFSVYRKSS